MDDQSASALEQYRAICDFELAVFQMRFQTLSIFLAAVGFLIGLTHGSRASGALLVMLTFGLWIIDLRNRDRLVHFKEIGKRAEANILGSDGTLFRERPTPESPVTIGVFNARVEVKRQHFGLVSFQVGIDTIFSGVMGYGIWALVGRHGLYDLLFFGPFLVIVLTALIIKVVQQLAPPGAAAGHDTTG